MIETSTCDVVLQEDVLQPIDTLRLHEPAITSEQPRLTFDVPTQRRLNLLIV
jgi:hypothetical protein